MVGTCRSTCSEETGPPTSCTTPNSTSVRREARLTRDPHHTTAEAQHLRTGRSDSGRREVKSRLACLVDFVRDAELWVRVPEVQHSQWKVRDGSQGSRPYYMNSASVESGRAETEVDTADLQFHLDYQLTRHAVQRVLLSGRPAHPLADGRRGGVLGPCPAGVLAVQRHQHAAQLRVAAMGDAGASPSSTDNAT